MSDLPELLLVTHNVYLDVTGRARVAAAGGRVKMAAVHPGTVQLLAFPCKRKSSLTEIKNKEWTLHSYTVLNRVFTFKRIT